MDNKSVLNIADVELSASKHGRGFAAHSGQMAAALGINKLGCRLTVLPAGKRAFPFHCHHANDELFFIIEGRGRYRIGEATYPVTPGDLLAAPAGGIEHAHQLINDSDAPLKYLAFSSMREPDVMEYPDSGKFGVFAGAAPGGDKRERTFSVFAPLTAAVDYWDGEQGD